MVYVDGGEAGSSYVAAYQHNETGHLLVIDETDTYYNFTGWNVTHQVGFSSNGADALILYDGDYKIDYSISFSGGANTEYHLTIFVNDDEKYECHFARKIGTGGDVGNGGATCILSLVSGDVITTRIENVDNKNDINVYDANVNIMRVA